jgi:hypothetical protein
MGEAGGGYSYPDSAEDDPFGGHEFCYESSTDLFRCSRCAQYEVVARSGDGPIATCPGHRPEGTGPLELNAF